MRLYIYMYIYIVLFEHQIYLEDKTSLFYDIT
jgi:hypothetical protein